MFIISQVKIFCSLNSNLATNEKCKNEISHNNLNLVSFHLLGITAALENSCHSNKCFNFKANILIINTMPKKTFGRSLKQQIELN
jgi:hypothetical protein